MSLWQLMSYHRVTKYYDHSGSLWVIIESQNIMITLAVNELSKSHKILWSLWQLMNYHSHKILWSLWQLMSYHSHKILWSLWQLMSYHRVTKLHTLLFGRMEVYMKVEYTDMLSKTCLNLVKCHVHVWYLLVERFTHYETILIVFKEVWV